MSFKTTGKVLQVLPELKGTSARGEWKKQDFIIETAEEQYPKKICFTLFNDKIGTLDKIKPNMDVEVSFNIESREYNEKWFSNINAFRVDVVSQNPNTSATTNTNTNTGNYPPPPVQSSYSSDGDMGDKDDLPF